MALASGSRLGSYEITAPLGAGGMGEVYRARDTRLGRDVAIKILPAVFVNDANRLARFEREARTLAALNHANIAQVFGLEVIEPGPSTGEARSSDYALVMEFVDGDDLSAVIARGPMPISDALPIARQIARALEAAHEAGIVHRDLKPANIKVRPDGTVKVLDFGLAKAVATDAASADAMQSPTMTSPATELGVIIGTAAYMSPEQARGKPVDRRADVWAFGVVLYEMLSGRRAFTGSEVSDVLASVLKDTLPFGALPKDTPSSIRRLLRRCLEKDRAERLDSMAAARLEIADALASAGDHLASEERATTTAAGSRLGAVGIPAAASLAGAALAGILMWWLLQPAAPVPSSFALSPPGGGALGVNINQPDLAISPDGRRIVYGDALTDASTLTVRSLDGFGDEVLTNMGRQPRSPFSSPDGRWMGYFAAADSGLDARLMKWPIAGGAPVEIAKVVGNLRGAFWTADDTIYFATTTPTGLMRVSAEGGTPEVLTTPDANAGENDHLWPVALPDGKHLLFVISRRVTEGGAGTAWDIAALDVATKTWRVIRPGGSYPRYIPTGHLVYATERGLAGVAFDPVTLEFSGDAVMLIGDVVFKPTSGAADVSISDTGTIAYVAGSAQEARRLAWIDRRGQTSPVGAEPRRYLQVRLSPDGRRAAVVVDDSGAGTLWVYDFARDTLMRLSPVGMVAAAPVWSETSRDIFFLGFSTSERGVFRIPASGTSPPELLIATPQDARLWPSSVVPGRSAILVSRVVTDGRQDVQTLTLDGTPALTPLLAGATAAEISPDGRWIAYLGADATELEVFLRPFPDVNTDRIKISSGGARPPRWAAGGRMLFYQGAGAARQIWMVDIGAPGSGRIGKPVPLMMPGGDRIDAGFDVAPDGERVLVIQPLAVEETRSELRVVVNWFEAVKQKFRQ